MVSVTHWQIKTLSPDWSLALIQVSDAGALFRASCGTKSSDWKWNGGRRSRLFFTKLYCFWLCGKSDTKWHWESDLRYHSEQPQQADTQRSQTQTYTLTHECQSCYTHTHTTAVHTITANHTVFTRSCSVFFVIHTHTHTLTQPPHTAALRPQPLLHLYRPVIRMWHQ